MNKRRVVVTGMGAISPVGNNLAETWSNLMEGKSGLGRITHFDPEGFSCTVAGEVKDFDPTLVMDAKEARKMDRFIQLGMVAGIEAIDNSGLEVTEENAERIGVYIGAGIGGMNTIEATTTTYNERGPRRVSPFYIPMAIINMISGNLSIRYGLKGPNLSMVTACSTGTHAIGEAGRLIEYGDADVMVAGGAEATITPTSIAGFGSAKALSKRGDVPSEASCPWDSRRDGFVMGEGAGVLVLEEYEHAKARGATIYAELAGFGMSGDAYHMTSPSPGGEGAARCMRNAMRHAGLDTTDVDYLNAHGTSTPQGDIAETMAVKVAFGGESSRIAVSSIKSMIGHLLGAAGGVEAVSTVMSIYKQALPPTINLHNPDPECDLDYVPNVGRDSKVRAALSNSFGFGGTNGTLAFKKV
ncbi:MAG: 3-oxoacyl-[acyl-carrier-protein] synthase II [Saprospiraceae bacterium]|jgi:3-oxoacyl-[acyl-carrier-protein] synthase II